MRRYAISLGFGFVLFVQAGAALVRAEPQPPTVSAQSKVEEPASQPAAAPAQKMQDQIPKEDGNAGTTGQASPPAQPADPAAPSEDAPPATDQQTEVPTDPDTSNSPSDVGADEDISIGEIPDIKQVDLTPDNAKKALDSFILIKEKYKNARLEDYETLQDFVEKDPEGKSLDSDIKAAGFLSVDQWNQTINTLTSTYSNLMDDQTDEIQHQIEEAQQDATLAQDMKDKLVSSLKATIPTAANTAVVLEMLKDPALADKFKQLETEGE